MVLWGWAFSYERDTPVTLTLDSKHAYSVQPWGGRVRGVTRREAVRVHPLQVRGEQRARLHQEPRTAPPNTLAEGWPN